MDSFGLPPFEYSKIETQCVEAYPHLRPAAEEYWEYEGPPGDDSGPYIFFGDVVLPYFTILLAMPSSEGRDRHLDQGFRILDLMLAEDASVADMVWISLFEGQAQWWLAESRPFVGPKAREGLDEYQPEWRSAADPSGPPDEIIDLYGAGDVVLDQLRTEGIDPQDVPGVRVPRRGRSLSSIDAARSHDNGVVILSCFGTSHPAVVAPASEVACEHETLMALATDIAKLRVLSRGEAEPAEVGYYRISVGERVWRMFGPEFAAALRRRAHYRTPGLVEHDRWNGETWLSPFFPVAVQDRIRSILSGQSARL